MDAANAPEPRCHLARQSTTEHHRFPQNSRKSPGAHADETRSGKGRPFPGRALYAICILHMIQASGRTTAIRRANTRQWVLKPQDLAVALKLVSLHGERMPYAALAKQMRLSPFEVHAAVQRLLAARLATEHTGTVRPSMAALRTFLINGAPYAYPPVRGETTIGFPTSHAVPPLSERVQSSVDLPPVWPHPEGTSRGQALLPLYDKLPLAAADDPKLYELLALFDALRIGQARERELAKKLLEERLQ